MSHENVEVVRRGASVRRVALLLAALLAVTLTLALAPRTEAFVYWTGAFGGTIGRANLDGTGVDKRFITDARAPVGVAVDATHVYWANWKTRAIGRANLDGTGVDQSFIRTERRPYGVAVDAEHVYWTDTAGAIGRANLDGTGADPDFIGDAIDLNANGVSVDAAHIYWTDEVCDDLLGCVDTIARANLDGTGVDRSFITVTDASVLTGVAVDAGHVYWTAKDYYDTGVLGRASLDGTGVNQSFIAKTGGASGAAEPSGVAVDARHVYWANYSGYSNAWNFIGRANIDGTGADRRLIARVNGPGGVAVDALPSFSFGKVNMNKRKGTARLTVKVPGPGELDLAKTKKVKADDESAEDAGKEKLSIKPRGKAKKKLNRTGKAKVTAEVTYTPDGGEANAQTKRVRLIKRRGGDRRWAHAVQRTKRGGGRRYPGRW
jgi:hypothetical protein